MPQTLALEEYNSSYFVSAHGGQPRNSLAMAFFSGIARLRLAHIDRYLSKNNVSVSRVLELGPGPGFFSRIFLEKHPGVSYTAIETDTSCHASLKDAGVQIFEASNRSKESSSVDLVVMSHVLEHVSNPVEFLTDNTRALRRGGVLFIEVPCRDWEHKPVDEPHLLFFDKGPMQYLLKQLNFDDIQLSYHGQEIEQLRSASAWRAKLMGIRSKLIDLGLVAPFAQVKPGMETLADPLERAVLAPFQAHCETQRPAWWLRAVARKG